jgi:hypothetical protein
VNALVAEARAALDPAILLPTAVASLDAVAGLFSLDES